MASITLGSPSQDELMPNPKRQKVEKNELLDLPTEILRRIIKEGSLYLPLLSPLRLVSKDFKSFVDDQFGEERKLFFKCLSLARNALALKNPSEEKARFLLKITENSLFLSDIQNAKESLPVFSRSQERAKARFRLIKVEAAIDPLQAERSLGLIVSPYYKVLAFIHLALTSNNLTFLERAKERAFSLREYKLIEERDMILKIVNAELLFKRIEIARITAEGYREYPIHSHPFFEFKAWHAIFKMTSSDEDKLKALTALSDCEGGEKVRALIDLSLINEAEASLETISSSVEKDYSILAIIKFFLDKNDLSSSERFLSKFTNNSVKNEAIKAYLEKQINLMGCINEALFSQISDQMIKLSLRIDFNLQSCNPKDWDVARVLISSMVRSSRKVFDYIKLAKVTGNNDDIIAAKELLYSLNNRVPSIFVLMSLQIKNLQGKKLAESIKEIIKENSEYFQNPTDAELNLDFCYDEVSTWIHLADLIKKLWKEVY